MDSWVKIKYLTSIMFGNAKAQNVVIRGSQGIREISHSYQTNTFFHNWWTKHEEIYTEQIQPDTKGERLLTASKVPTKLFDSCLPQ